MSIWEAILLGIIQGLTEFLPISSSGHIELGKFLSGAQLEEHLLFSVVMHVATACSTLVIFRKEVGRLVVGLLQLRFNDETQLAAHILISMIPVGIVGVFFKQQIEFLFEGQITLVACMLMCTGLLLLFAHYFQPKRRSEMSFGKAFLIGVAQAIAILPGISRSGATIAAALLLGIKREQAAPFSFLMVLPPILGAALLETKDYLTSAEPMSIPANVLLGGFIAAFVVGMFACKAMIQLVRNSKLIYFAIYCLTVGAFFLIYHLLTH
ncbi:MAG: undecaprenyl-diphosphate phosphatase [Cytophagales bacterium]|nr:undecaprenyl-diphosphate phosphatase [Bernardetiaceae bacterium]MDW8204714.1 undecaprenyl-diphosphate phosphatase [Cytophagales bacterium]